MNTLVTSHIYKAPIQDVWDAFTNPDIMIKWWAPGPMEPHEIILEGFEVGKRFRYSFEAPSGFVMWGQGGYTDIQAPHKLGYTDSFTDHEGNLVPRSYYSNEGVQEGDPIIEEQVMITFTEVDGGTEMRFEIDYYADPAMIDMVKASWDTMFGKLHDVFAK